MSPMFLHSPWGVEELSLGISSGSNGDTGKGMAPFPCQLISFLFCFSAEPRSYVESVARTATTGRAGNLPAAQPVGLEVPARNGAFGNSFTVPSPISTSSPIHSMDG